MKPSRRTVRARWWCPAIPVVALWTILAVSVVAQNVDNYIECKVDEFCVRQDQCVDGKIDTVGAVILVPRSGMSVVNCDKFGMTCCRYTPSDNDDESMEVPAPSATTESNHRSTTEEPEEPEEPDEQDDPNWSAQCGQRTVDASHTDHSTATTRFEFPWNVALFNLKKLAGKRIREFLCGGTLIDDYVVVTAARCVHQRSVDKLRVQVGRWNFDKATEPRIQDIVVERVISHPKYVPSSHVHNIALLVLSNAVTMGRAANRICLSDYNISHTTDGLCYVTGWRNVHLDGVPNHLHKFRVSFQDPKDCTQRIRGATGALEFRLPKENVCTDYIDDIPTCPRAPGSALICDPDASNSNQQFFFAGIASHDLRGCSKTKRPEVYLKISDYIRWVHEHLVAEGREPSFSQPDPPDSSE